MKFQSVKNLIFTFSILAVFQNAGADTYLLSTQLNRDSGDFYDLRKMVGDPQVRLEKVEDFLAQWKNKKSAFFSQYVLGYRSRSLQKATPLSPRAILFNANADLIFSFNGHKDHKDHKGFNDIEIMRFNHDKDAFEFYEISFKQGSRGQLSPPNPRKCLECHQSETRAGVDPRPNWEPYNTWLGFYGSIDDDTEMFKDSYGVQQQFKAPEDQFVLKELQNEKSWYDDFTQNILPKHPRYSYLDPSRNRYGDAFMNGDLTDRLATLNFRRIARLMTAEKAVYDYVKWTVWGYARCVQTFYVSKPVVEWLMKNTPREEISMRERKVTYGMIPHGGDPETSQGATYTEAKYATLDASYMINFMFEPFGVSTEDWSMDFKTNGARFAAFERFGLQSDPRPPLSAAIQKIFGEDPDFKNMDCQTAERKSLENFGDVNKVIAFRKSVLASAPPRPTAKPLITRCISCHVEEQGHVPHIPFNSEQHLRQALQKSGYKRGRLIDEIAYRTGSHAEESEQMPPRGSPSNEQREQLLRYLKNLVP